MKKAPPSPSEPNGDSDSAQRALAWVAGSRQGDELIDRIEASARRNRLGRFVAVSGGLAAVVIAGLFLHSPKKARLEPAVVSPSATAFVTVPATQTLSDGSIVDLRDGAKIAVHFTSSFRRVVLQNGEAHFSVAKNKDRPFIVEASGVEVRAIGTVFSVQLSGAEQVKIMVTEGRVAVDSPIPNSRAGQAPVAHGLDSGPQTIATVDAGNRVVVELSRIAAPVPIIAVSEEEQNEALSWRAPRLDFSGTPLSEAVPLFSKYSRTRMVLDPVLGPLQISGVLRGDNKDSFLRLLKNEFSIVAERRGEEIYLHKP